MLFPAANDLLTMFVALEVLSLPLYLLCGLARRRRLLSQEAALKYFLLGAFSSAFFLYGMALLYGYAGLGPARRRSRAAAGSQHRQRPLLFAGHRAARRRPAVQGRRGAVPRVDAGRLPGRADPGHRAHGGRAPRSPRSARCCGCSTSRSASWPGTGGRCCGCVAILTMVVGVDLAITQTDVKRLLAYSSIAHAGFILIGVIAASAAGPVRHAVLPGRLRLHHDRRVRGGHPGARRRRRGRPPVAAGPAWASGRRWWPGCSRFSCWPSPASR